jgi:para-aminobenzoate synthetase/4-amino-4-deoxychorismate lyase
VADFRLYEALLYEPARGYFLLERHLARLARSAAHFGFAIDCGAIRKRLDEYAAALEAPRKVRVELSRDGSLLLEVGAPKPTARVRVALAREPVSSAEERLRHKTSRREVYERARAARPDVEDVVLWNERRELTETCSANLVLELDGRKLTPPVECGLLPGTFRAELLARGQIEEAVLPVESLDNATSAWLVNSVRRWCELDVVA